jgi:oxygen-dependent protoporphyrinogen oxidase
VSDPAVVIGAGISGLTAAWRLKQQGRPVVVVDSAAEAGGVMRSRLRDGFLCEEGPNSFQTSPEVLELVREAGLERELVTAGARLPRYIYYKGRLERAPMSPVALLSTPLLTAGEKVRALREPWIERARGQEDESLADFVTRRFGATVLRNFVAPLVSGIYAGDAARLSARAVFPQLVDWERKNGSVLRGLIGSARRAPKPRVRRLLATFREGLQTLPLALAAGLGGGALRLGTRVEALRSESGRLRLDLHTPSGTEVLPASAVILAAPAYHAAEMVRPLSAALAAELAAIEYPPLASVCIAFRSSEVPRALDGFGFLAPRGEGLRALGCIWSSSLFSGRAPEGSALLTLFLGGATDPGVAGMSDDAVADQVRRDLAAALGIQAPGRVVQIRRLDRAIPQYALGHPARVERIEAELRRIPGLHLAGNYLRGVSIGDCVKQAGELAGRLVAT